MASIISDFLKILVIQISTPKCLITHLLTFLITDHTIFSYSLCTISRQNTLGIGPHH